MCYLFYDPLICQENSYLYSFCTKVLWKHKTVLQDNKQLKSTQGLIPSHPLMHSCGPMSAHTGHSITHMQSHLTPWPWRAPPQSCGATGWCCHLDTWIQENTSIMNRQQSAWCYCFLDISICWSRDRKFNILATCCCFGLFILVHFPKTNHLVNAAHKHSHLYPSSEDLAWAT